MADLNKDFINISVHREVFKSYINWTSTVSTTHFTKRYWHRLKKILDDDVRILLAEKQSGLSKNSINDTSPAPVSQRVGSDITTNSHYKVCHMNIVDEIEAKYYLNALELQHKMRFKIDIKDIKEIVQKHTHYIDVAKVREQTNLILKLLNMQTIRLGNSYFAIYPEYRKETGQDKLYDYLEHKRDIQKRVNTIFSIMEEENGISPKMMEEFIGDNEELKRILNNHQSLTFDEKTNRFKLTSYHRQRAIFS